jgi:glycosyltransferase involved in cell wall biosynthesis
MTTDRVIMVGPFTGFSSYPTVMRGLAQAFEHWGLEVVRADLSGVGQLSTHDTRSLTLGVLPEKLKPGLIFAIKPSPMMGALVDQGCKVVGMHVGDVDRVPTEWQLAMEYEEFVVVPSSWMQVVVTRDVADTEVIVSQHGIDDIYLGAKLAQVPAEGFRFLHCCSAAAFPERKGTPQALRAFERHLERQPGLTLTLVVPELRRPIKRLLGALSSRARENVLVQVEPYGVDPARMIRLYQDHHALLCPSRAEGFGMQPLEARALGVPVVQTFCTGMADHTADTNYGQYPPGTVYVHTGAFEEAWGGFGLAPGLTDDAVYAAMAKCLENYGALSRAARKAAVEMGSWSWVERTRGLAERLMEI